MRSADEAEFADFARLHARGLLRFAYLLTGHLADAEDLVQIALGKTLLAWSSVRKTSLPDAYVRRIIVNSNASRFRLARNRREIPYPVLPDRADTDDVTLADDRLFLATALGGLPPRQRAVIVLRYLEDRTEAEVAELLGVTVGTVKSQAAKALAHLRADPALGTVDTGRTRD